MPWPLTCSSKGRLAKRSTGWRAAGCGTPKAAAGVELVFCADTGANPVNSVMAIAMLPASRSPMHGFMRPD
jgi:hypothetical protein